MQDKTQESLDLKSIRERLAGETGPRYWQSLEELANTEGFQDFLHREFPRAASEWVDDEPGRRKFVKLMGASLALAGLTACTKQPEEKIVPYVRQPEEIIPGKPLFFATAMNLSGAAIGVLAESHEGRPTKIEGNPDHPASLGAADLVTQASVLQLYDPDRAQTVLRYGEISTYSSFIKAFKDVLEDQKKKPASGIRFLTETVTSPTLTAQIRGVLKDYPGAKWYQYEPCGPHHLRAGAKLAFGEPLAIYYKVAAANVILTLDSDFLTNGPGAVRYAREFADQRRVRGGEHKMNRMYSVESTPSNTGGKADHRYPLRASEIAAVAAAVARELGVETGSIAASAEPWIKNIAADLKKNAGASLVVAGDAQPPAVQALALAINQALGNIGKTVMVTEPVEANPADQFADLKSLIAEMNSGAVEVLILLGGNPIYNAPADFGFGEAFKKAGLRIHLNLYNDETAELCHWLIPESHYLESWGEARAHDGTLTIQQPLIAPLYQSKSALELLAVFGEQAERSGYEILREAWTARKPAPDFESWWRKSVHDGVVAGSAAAPKNPVVKAGWSAGLSAPAAQGMEILFRPDIALYDGRFSNLGWLQELPKPITKVTWDNMAMMSVATAEKLHLDTEDVVELKYQGRTVKAPVWITPGHANDSVTVYLGYGRRRAGHVGNGVGFDAYTLRTAGAPTIGTGLEVVKTGEKHTLASTQEHWRMDGFKQRDRNLVRAATIEEFLKEPQKIQEADEVPPKTLSLYPERKYEGYAWGMSIDLSACNGCNACVVACQAENNIPVVGKDQVSRGREMHWIRVDRYYEGDLDSPLAVHQPVNCQQCENAPCEVVCPVAATSHSAEGLNDMVYNRCVGTRYCSHNCPYKVRRFNFLLYSDFETESLKLQRNPDVSVRSRGVMEKCTYCVQRINRARIEAEKEDRPIRDGEIVPACAQTCPTQAIVFGDINSPDSRVAKLKKEQLDYMILADLNTRPRTSYMAVLRNPNPELARETKG